MKRTKGVSPRVDTRFPKPFQRQLADHAKAEKVEPGAIVRLATMKYLGEPKS